MLSTLGLRAMDICKTNLLTCDVWKLTAAYMALEKCVDVQQQQNL